MELKRIVDALITAGFADLFELSLVGCLRNVLMDFFINNSNWSLYINCLIKILKGGKNMGYPKKHRGRRKIGSKKRRARKRNKKK